MSTTTTTTVPIPEWICILPDNDGAHAARLEARPLHFERLQKLSGFITFGGAALNELPLGDNIQDFKFYGSILTAKAATREEVVALLKQDPYTLHGVWNWDKAQIFPFRCAIREPL